MSISSSSAAARAACAPPASRPATARRVMLAEEYRIGGTCVIRGCVPKKLLVYASRFARRVRGRRRLRLDACAEARFDWATLIRNKDAEIARLEGVYRANLESGGRRDRRQPRRDRGRAHGAAREDRRARSGAATSWSRPAPTRRSSRRSPAASSASPRTRCSISRRLPERILVVGGGYIAVRVRRHLRRPRQPR